MLKIPYGISYFEKLRKEDYYFLDRTNFIEILENENRSYLFFLRPRRFGKSLFVSMLEHYYGIEHKNKFQELFEGTYIGKNKTPKASNYLVLNFNFSGINTDREEDIENAFNRVVYDGLVGFLSTYRDVLDVGPEIIHEENSASALLRRVLTQLENSAAPPIYLLIDEYDHFTNELLSFNLNYFRKSVSSNGYIRKFYEVIKIGTGTGVVDRLFVTGVAPVTLDSLTSGFNISSNISMELNYHSMMGMHHNEVIAVLKGVGVPEDTLTKTMTDLTNWYNGYSFNKNASQRLFNTNMVLYFASHYARYNEYPQKLIDTNLATDYKKVANLFQINPEETQSKDVLQALVKKELISSELVIMFEMGRRWYRKDLISLLYWMGFLTIQDQGLAGYNLCIPNFVMESLYRDFYIERLLEQRLFSQDPHVITQAIVKIATEAELQPFIDIVREIMHNLSTRDQRHFNEMSLKAIFVSLLFQQQFYLTRSEVEVQKTNMGKGYVDVYCQTLPNFETTFDAVFELKQAKNTDVRSLKDMLAEDSTQLQNYSKDPTFTTQPRATAFFVVACKGAEVEFERVM